jgi:tight adherence protein C
MVLLAILAVVLLALAVGFAVSAALVTRLRRSDNLEQIEAYGYSGRAALGLPAQPARKSLDDIATAIGEALARRFRSLHEDEIQRELIQAGFFNVGPRKFLGYRVLLTIALPLGFIWFFGILGASALLLFIFAIAGVAIGWAGPKFVLARRGRQRLQAIDDAVPGLIDLLVVTLEAGVGFTAALRMAADRLEGPLGEEVRLTIQEQSLGLSTLEALESWLRRCDTPAVRSFVRAMIQGDRLGVSIGQILRNQAIEMRARRKQIIEERAHKAPIKILFPLVFLIFPAMFIIILGPALFRISSGF